MIKHIQQNKILEMMYSKHLVSPSYVEKELQARGKSINSSDLLIDDLLPFDQDHFGGVDPTELCILACEIDGNSNILDIGGGLGGPARYIAWRTGCRVTGVEIQEDRYDFSVQVTKKLYLDKQVDFIHGDIYEIGLPKDHYTHAISFLTILHIFQKKSLLESIGHLLKVKGRIYIEDYCRGIGYSSEVENDLLETISCPGLLSTDEYINSLAKGGIYVDNIYDTTAEWKQQAKKRVEDFNRNFEEKIRIHGKVPIANAIQFSKGVSTLFEKKVISGIRLIGTKKS